MNRRDFVLACGAGAFSRALPGWAGLPLFAQANAPLQMLDSARLNFGTSIYPFRKNLNPQWLLAEAASLGLTELRIEYSRDRVELTSNDQVFDPRQYHEPRPEVLRLLRQSRFNILFVLDGSRRDANKRKIDWPRNEDGSVNGTASALGMRHYTRWALSQTGDIAYAYELWNEAFNTLFDQGFLKKGFGPGGSQQNADNYSAMLLPSLREIRRHGGKQKILVEGNYWNLERSVDTSTSYQALLREADFAVIHPYGYKLHFYEPATAENPKPGLLYQVMRRYPQINPNIAFWYTEYGVSAKDVGRTDNHMPDFTQAKAVLRATLLHLAAGVEHLDVFCMYYPSIAHFSLIDAQKKRRPAWYALQRLLAAIGPGKTARAAPLQRTSALPNGLRDLAIATHDGPLYMVWQETPVGRFDTTVPMATTKLTLRGTNSAPYLRDAIDPISGKAWTDVHTATRGNDLEITLPVADYPCLLYL